MFTTIREIALYLVHVPYRIYITTWLFICFLTKQEIPTWLEKYVDRERENDNVWTDEIEDIKR